MNYINRSSSHSKCKQEEEKKRNQEKTFELSIKQAHTGMLLVTAVAIRGERGGNNI
jgi:hypothetical protein